MGNYVVSARKYRPGTFSSVVGQSHITQTLKSAIVLDQLAHAFLFSGPRGVGKTTCARILAKAINCENLREDGEPCNQCNSCETYNQGKSLNIHELDAASNNSVDDIRSLIEQTRYVPPNGKKSVYIIDEVHMLSQAAFNAFLKTLEEPPSHVLFILATTEKHKILPTILSRCQKFDFRRIKVEDIAQHLEYISKEEQINYEYAALQQIALKADGALRDALSLYDQLVSFSQQALTFQMVLENLNILDYDYYFKAVNFILAKDHTSLLLLLHEIIEQGFEAKDFLIGLTEHFRNLLMCQTPETIVLLETSENVRKQYEAQSKKMDNTFLVNAFQLCSQAESQMKTAALPRLTVELSLIKLAHLTSAIHIVLDQSDSVPEKKNLVNNIDPTTPLVEKKLSSAPITPDQVPKKPSIEPEKNNDVTTNIGGKVDDPEVKLDSKEPIEEKEKSSNKKRPKEKKIVQAEFKLSQNLQQVQQVLRSSSNDSDSDEADDTKRVFEIHSHIEISRESFNNCLHDYTEILKKKDKYTLASILQEANHELENNKWNCKVPTEFASHWIKRDSEIVPYFREKLAINELFMEVSSDEKVKESTDIQPYTQEEKLKVMGEKNPALEQLKKLFKTRIIYR